MHAVPALLASIEMHVLVTGGAGFIGSHFIDRLLAAGHDVRVLDSLDPQVHNGWPDYLAADIERIEGDVRDRDAVKRALEGVDRLVHLAAAVGVGQSMYEIERYTSVNAMGAAVVLEAAMDVRAQLEKVVVASSMSIYGEGLYRCPAEDVLQTPEPRSDEQLARREWELVCPSCGTALEPAGTPESKPLQPLSIYAVGKRDHEEMFLAWGRAYKVPTTALRFFNVYGPRQALSNPYTGVAAIFASRLLNGRPPVVFEDGRQSRDFVHVTDIAAGVEAALEAGQRRLPRHQPRNRRLDVGACASPRCSRASSAWTSSRSCGRSIAPATSGTASATSRSRSKSWGTSRAWRSTTGCRSWRSGSPTKRPRIAWRRRPQHSSSEVSPANAVRVAWPRSPPRVRPVARLSDPQAAPLNSRKRGRPTP